jgi:hypothetical protein
VRWSHDADDEVLSGGFDDFFGDGGDLVDLQEALDLVDESGGEAEVAVGDAGDGGDGFAGGVVVGVVQAQVGPVAGQDEGLFVDGQGLVVVDEADAGVELGVAGQAFLVPSLSIYRVASGRVVRGPRRSERLGAAS